MTDTGKVVSLRGGPVDVAVTVQEGVVEMLSELLDRARRGEIVALATVLVTPVGEVSHITADPAAENAIEIAAGLVALQHQVGATLNGQAE